MIQSILNISRLFRIIYIITKYKIHISNNYNAPLYVKIILHIFTLLLHPIIFFTKSTESLGSRATKCLTELGPIYIKFGQTLSTRPDLIGADIAEALKELQDKLPPFDAKIAKEIIEKQLNEKLSNIFSEFHDAPIAAASIAQVHQAILHSGSKVAVKILRPGIYKQYNCDIELLIFCAKILHIFLKNTKRLKLHEVTQLFKRTMQSELDLQIEAASAATIYDNFKKDNNLYIPKIYWEYTSKSVLTLEWIDGISIYDIDQIIKLGLDKRHIAAKIAVIFFNQAFRDGIFHADLHPGNVLVRFDGSIAMIDFGIIGRLAQQDRLGIAEILYGFLNRDYDLVAKVHKDVKYIPENTDLHQFALKCRVVADPIIGCQAQNISIGKLLSELFKITEEFGMETQPQLVLLQKTMVVVEGIGKSLDQEINMWQLAEPWIKKWYAKNLSPEAKILRIVHKYIEKLFKTYADE